MRTHKKVSEAEKVLLSLRPGDAAEVPSPFPGLGDEKILLTLTTVSPLSLTFAASYYGIEIGPLRAEYTDGQSGLKFIEEKV